MCKDDVATDFEVSVQKMLGKIYQEFYCLLFYHFLAYKVWPTVSSPKSDYQNGQNVMS